MYFKLTLLNRYLFFFDVFDSCTLSLLHYHYQNINAIKMAGAGTNAIMVVALRV